MMSEKPQNERSKRLLVSDDSFAALVRAYMQSPKFMGYSEGTRERWGRELRFVGRPDTLGAKRLEEMRPSLIQAYLDALDGRPGKQAAARDALAQLEKWAIVRDLVPRQFMIGVETERPRGGHLPWTDAEVELGERHARADLARAITLAANTGQRGSDLVRMCWTDIETYKGIAGINVIQVKTGKQVWVPITSALRAAMERWERRPGPFLTKEDGMPYTRTLLSHAWVWHKAHNPALDSLNQRGLVLHGLRGTACVRLRQAGATIPQIADAVGMSEPLVSRYCRFSLQKENAVAAVYHLERTLGERDAIRERKNRS
jgi:integrase